MKRIFFLTLMVLPQVVLAERGLITDRPNKTESSYTVPKGRFQFETDLINNTADKDKASDTETQFLQVNNINLKFGVTDDTDFQLVLPSYVERSTKTNGKKTTDRAFGDVVLRYKRNIFGNDGAQALGIMPYVKLPTAGAGITNRYAEGGVILPLNLTLPNDWGFGVQLQVDHLRRTDNASLGNQTDYVLSATVAHTIVGDLAGFVEVFSRTSDNRNQGAISTLDLGLTYVITPNWMVDTGAFIGITPDAPDLQTFVGLSALF